MFIWASIHINIHNLRALSMTGQTIPVVIRILLSIKTIQPDPSNPKYYARRRWFFSKNCWQKPISLSKCRTSHGLAGQFWLLESALTSAIRSKIKGCSSLMCGPSVEKGVQRLGKKQSFSIIFFFIYMLVLFKDVYLLCLFTDIFEC